MPRGAAGSTRVGDRSPSRLFVLSVAFNDRCDVVVATAAVHGEAATLESAVLEFLNGDLVLRWAEKTFGL